MNLAKQSSSGANFNMELGLSDSIAKLQALQKEMQKTFGELGANNTIELTLNLKVDAAKQALKELAATPIELTVKVDAANIRSQVKKALSGIGFTPRVNSVSNMPNQQQMQTIRSIPNTALPSSNSAVQQQMFDAARATKQALTQSTQQPQQSSYMPNWIEYNQGMARVTAAIQNMPALPVPRPDYFYNNLKALPSPTVAQFTNRVTTPALPPATDFWKAERQYEPSWNTYNPQRTRIESLQTPALPGVAGWPTINEGPFPAREAGPQSYSEVFYGKQKSFQTWGMTSTPGSMYPWESQTKQSMTMGDAFGLYMFSNTLRHVATSLESAFSKVEQAYDTSALSFRKTQLVAGMPGGEFENYKNNLLDLAGQTMTSIPIMAEMGYSFATRGYMNPGTANETLRPLATAGLITGEDPVVMGKSVMSLMQAWNPDELVSLEQRAPNLVGEMADVMTYAYANSPLETAWFKDIANYAAPVFAGLGFEPTETMSTFMAMSQMIPTAGIGARSSRMALSNLFDVNKLETVSGNYGIDMMGEIESIRESGGGLAEVFQMVSEQVQKLPEIQQNAFLREIGGGVRGGMALQALLPVISNIKTYEQNINENAAGYTLRQEYAYSTTPYGQLQRAESEREAIMYGTGEKTVGIRTSIMRLENAILKLVTKMPSEVLAAGYAAGKGFEGVASVTSQVANIAIIKILSERMKGIFGGFGSMLTGASLAVPIAAAVAGALSEAMQKDQNNRQSDLQDSIVDENVLDSYNVLLGAVDKTNIRKKMDELDNQYSSGKISSAEYDQKQKQLLGDNLLVRLGRASIAGADTLTGQGGSYLINGEIVSVAEAQGVIQQAMEFGVNGRSTVVGRLPVTEDTGKELDEYFKMAESLFGKNMSFGDFNVSNLQDRLENYVRTSKDGFGDTEGITDVTGLQEKSLENIDAYMDGLVLPKMPELEGKAQPKLFSMYYQAFDKQGEVGWGDEDYTTLSMAEAGKYMKEALSSGILRDHYGAEESDEMIQFGTVALPLIQTIIEQLGGGEDILATIKESVDNIASETSEGGYLQAFDSWIAGEYNNTFLPGQNGEYGMVMGWGSGDRQGSLGIAPVFSDSTAKNDFYVKTPSSETDRSFQDRWFGPAAQQMNSLLEVTNSMSMREESKASTVFV